MIKPENFLKAAFNSIKARVKKTIIYSAYETANFMKDAPEIIKKEWNEFKDEVSFEAERINDFTNEEVSSEEIIFKREDNISPQKKIDQIRKKIKDLNNQVEEMH